MFDVNVDVENKSLRLYKSEEKEKCLNITRPWNISPYLA